MKSVEPKSKVIGIIFSFAVVAELKMAAFLQRNGWNIKMSSLHYGKRPVV